MTEKKYVLRFHHLDYNVPDDPVKVADTLEDAIAGAGIGVGLTDWTQRSEGYWYGDALQLRFWYTIHYEVPPAPPSEKEPSAFRAFMQQLGRMVGY